MQCLRERLDMHKVDNVQTALEGVLLCRRVSFAERARLAYSHSHSSVRESESKDSLGHPEPATIAEEESPGNFQE